MPCSAAATVRPNGMPHTSQARSAALVAPAIADFHGAKRHQASINASSSGGIEATSAERRMLPATGL